jgi:hypothetical protein
MRNLLLVFVLSTAFASVSSGAGQKPGTYTPVPLKVTVQAVDSFGNSCAICSDGMGDYIDGQQGVKATIDQYGDIIIDLQTARTQIRRLVYHYPATAAPPDGSHDYLSTLPLGNGALQAMVVNGPPISVASCPLFNDPSGQPQYRHGFFRDCGSGLGPEGSRLVVRRTALDQWEVEPEPGAWARVFSATTKGRTQVVVYPDLMSLPFKMTLTAR